MLWAITSYFNPAKYRRRRINYHRFRRALPMPLLTVELSFDGAYEIEGDNVIHVDGADVMWQKERLLNIGLESLPPSCDKVLSIDCDLLVDKQMPAALEQRLDVFPVVQPFSTVRHLDIDDRMLFTQPSLASVADQDVFAQLTIRQQASPSAGFMWGARRDILQRHGYYDACIIGGGDTAFACAAYGKFDHVMRIHYMNEWQRRYYNAWSEGVYRDVCGQVGYLDFTIRHMWHGSMKDRQAQSRHQGLSSFSFNPYTDIRQDGAWYWNSGKPQMHRFVKEYFALRNEDRTEPSPVTVKP